MKAVWTKVPIDSQGQLMIVAEDDIDMKLLTKFYRYQEHIDTVPVLFRACQVSKDGIDCDAIVIGEV